MDAQLSRVWDAWNDPDMIAKWWGPAGFHSTVRELDVRKGGRFEVIMHGPDGTDYPNVYVFDRVEELKQLVYTNLGSEQFGLAPFQSVVDLEAVGNKTRVVLKARSASRKTNASMWMEFTLSKAAATPERLKNRPRDSLMTAQAQSHSHTHSLNGAARAFCKVFVQRNTNRTLHLRLIVDQGGTHCDACSITR
jgi:uncharacterized protein YndB with AHSA1/START domain